MFSVLQVNYLVLSFSQFAFHVLHYLRDLLVSEVRLKSLFKPFNLILQLLCIDSHVTCFSRLLFALLQIFVLYSSQLPLLLFALHLFFFVLGFHLYYRIVICKAKWCVTHIKRWYFCMEGLVLVPCIFKRRSAFEWRVEWVVSRVNHLIIKHAS